MSGTAQEKKHDTSNREKVEEREWQIASAAYYLSEKRGFAPGRELDDWFRAEKAILEHRSDPGKMSGPAGTRKK